jgi:hypothetical protein
MDQVPRHLAFQHVAPYSGLQSFGDILLFIVAGQENDLGFRRAFPKLPRCLNPIQDGHAGIDDSNIELELGGKVQQFVSVTGLADNLESFSFQKALYPFPNDGVIVGEQYANGHVKSPLGVEPEAWREPEVG